MLAVAILAASIVPLAMAGWHLTRNKVLFFTAILFILLASAVHILPYAVTSFSSFHAYVLSSSNSCFRFLYHIDWKIRNSPSSASAAAHPAAVPATNPAAGTIDGQRNSSTNGTTNGTTTSVSWSWSNPSCNYQRFTRERATEYLSRSWIVVAGDSQARYFLVSLLELLMKNPRPVKEKLFKYHSDFEHYLEQPAIRTDFVWAPYTANLTTYVDRLHRNGSYPDVVIMGAGLWHMLHVTDASDYGTGLSSLRRRCTAAVPLSRLFWLSLPVLVPRLLNTEDKRVKMTTEVQSEYESELVRSNICSPDGPFRLLDMRRLTYSCGAQCTADGMHYVEAVYEVAVQLMLHSLVVTKS